MGPCLRRGDGAGERRREKSTKKWKRQRTLRLIREQNPHWRDLYEDIQTAL